MIDTLYIASANEGKVKEFERYLSNLEIDLKNLLEENLPSPIEDSGSFSGNALIKAKYYFNHFKKPVLADDSGLCIDALDGFPGVDTSEHKPKNGKFDSIYNLFQKTSNNTNTARFQCILCFIESNTLLPLFFEGVCEGTISEKPIGSNGFGFDPIFIPNGSNKTFAQMDIDEKRLFSARGKALSAFLDFLKNR